MGDLISTALNLFAFILFMSMLSTGYYRTAGGIVVLFILQIIFGFKEWICVIIVTTIILRVFMRTVEGISEKTKLGGD